jgi:hypothetical protein
MADFCSGGQKTPTEKVRMSVENILKIMLYSAILEVLSINKQFHNYNSQINSLWSTTKSKQWCIRLKITNHRPDKINLYQSVSDFYRACSNSTAWT